VDSADGFNSGDALYKTLTFHSATQRLLKENPALFLETLGKIVYGPEGHVCTLDLTEFRFSIMGSKDPTIQRLLEENSVPFLKAYDKVIENAVGSNSPLDAMEAFRLILTGIEPGIYADRSGIQYSFKNRPDSASKELGAAEIREIEMGFKVNPDISRLIKEDPVVALDGIVEAVKTTTVKHWRGDPYLLPDRNASVNGIPIWPAEKSAAGEPIGDVGRHDFTEARRAVPQAQSEPVVSKEKVG
jgi:hypothetical protein